MSGAYGRRKGVTFEQDVARWLRDQGWIHVERTPIGMGGRGDILGIPGWTIECKNRQSLDLAGWTAQAAGDARGGDWVVIVKKRGTTDIGESYAVTSLANYARLLDPPTSTTQTRPPIHTTEQTGADKWKTT